MSAITSQPAPDIDPLRDPHRIAAARRLFVEVPGPAAYDRLSALAARLVGAGHAKVTIFTDQDTVIGGYGLPEGVVGGPALLTGALSAITVRTGVPLDIPDARRDERVADLPAVTSGQVRAYLGAPLVAASGQIVGALAVYDPEPRQWSDDATALLEQLSASVVAELELSAAQSAVGTTLARLDVALEASAVGIWENDLRTGTFSGDERCAAVFGWDGTLQLTAAEILGYIHPDDHAAVQEAMGAALGGAGEYFAEARLLRADGAVRWTVSRGRAVTDARGVPVRVLGTILDVTDVREQAQRRLEAVQRAAALAEVAAELANATRIEQLADVALRGALVLGADSSGLAVFEPGGGPLRLYLTRRLADAARAAAYVEDPARGLELVLDDTLPTQYAARHGQRVLLPDPDEAIARFPRMAKVTDVLDIRALAALPLRVEGRVLGSFVPVWRTEHRFDGSEVDVLEALTAQIALSVSRLQADAERAAAVAAMAEANRHLQLLADVGRVLSGTLDIATQIEQLGDLVVPTLGDWCWIVTTDEHGRLTQLGAAHRDPFRRVDVAQYVQGMVAVMTEEAGARIVIGTGQPLVMPRIDQSWLQRALPDPAVRASLARLAPTSLLVVPLIAGGETLGALGLITGAQRGPQTQVEIETAVEIGRRAGLALRHARTFGRQRDLAVALQRSLLTAPPRPESCEIVVRYVPAAAGAEIGGDWYDAFLQADGTTVLAIGDVVGHDTRAAAAMAQARGLLRGISYSSGAGPAAVLVELDRALRGLSLDIMATSVVARLETDDLEPGDGAAARLRWSNAGHPPPLVVDPEGKVTVLSAVPTGLLLGVAPETPREEHLADLPPGATVLLYTDGLVERRTRDIDAGIEELVDELRECADLPLDELCDRVLQRLFLPDAEDDVAVLAVRLRA